MGDFGSAFFWSIQAVFVVRESLCDVGTPFWCPDKFTQGHLIKIKWLVTYVAAVGSPDIAEPTFWMMILVERCFGQFRLYLWSRSHFVM